MPVPNVTLARTVDFYQLTRWCTSYSSVLKTRRTRHELAPPAGKKPSLFGCVRARVTGKPARCSRCTGGATPCASRLAVPAAARRRWHMGTAEEIHARRAPARTGAASRHLVKERSASRRCGAEAQTHCARRRRKTRKARIHWGARALVERWKEGVFTRLLVPDCPGDPQPGTTTAEGRAADW
jgi:hypothetical protein